MPIKLCFFFKVLAFCLSISSEGHFTHLKKRTKFFQNKRIFTDFWWISLANKRIFAKGLRDLFEWNVPRFHLQVHVDLSVGRNTCPFLPSTYYSLLCIVSFLLSVTSLREAIHVPPYICLNMKSIFAVYVLNSDSSWKFFISISVLHF